MDISKNTSLDYSKFMIEGLENEKAWGYGFRRLTVQASPEEQIRCPYSFTGFGYKEQNGKLFLGLRMNVDQISPVRYLEWDGSNNVLEKFAEMMGHLLAEFIHKEKQKKSIINR